jgi:hypothetical protein
LLDQLPPRRVARFLGDRCEIAELALRGVARLWLGHAVSDVAWDRPLEVESQFLVELAVCRGALEKRSQADHGTLEHWCSY